MYTTTIVMCILFVRTIKSQKLCRGENVHVVLHKRSVIETGQSKAAIVRLKTTPLLS